MCRPATFASQTVAYIVGNPKGDKGRNKVSIGEPSDGSYRNELEESGTCDNGRAKSRQIFYGLA